MIEQTTNDNVPSRHDRRSLGWFGLGILVGAVAAIGLMSLTSTPRTSASNATDLGAIREAARLGAKDALLETNTGVTLPLSLEDIRNAAMLGVGDALKNGNTQDSVAGPANGQAAATAATPIDMKNIPLRANNLQGDAKAPVTLIEFSDFQCPFCKRFHDQVMPRIVTDYVKTGKVKVAYLNFAFLGQESLWAAQAAECAADQNRFWDFHELLFKNQVGENVGTFTKANLLNDARSLQINMEAFTACLNGDQTLARVQNDTDLGNKLGVRGTPSFVINGKLIVGAQPYEAFKTAIDAALSKQ
ncbi:MAG: DsbA family protein [Chloroflexi bacterium]|nr:DsbA family protein [Chloroflexota bacterium]MCL5273899.1 DsbA family protein [Chloroflexota bacterium]